MFIKLIFKILKPELRTYIGDNSISTFIFSELSNKLRSTEVRNFDESKKKLTSCNGFNCTDSLASEVVDALCSLPWSYKVFFTLNHLCSTNFSEHMKQHFDLSDEIRLFQFMLNSKIEQSFNKNKTQLELSLVNRILPSLSSPIKFPSEKTLGLEINLLGYIANYFDTETYHKLTKYTKDILMGLDLSGFVNINDKFDKDSFPDEDFLVYKATENDHEFIFMKPMDGNISRILKNLTIHKLYNDADNKDSYWLRAIERLQTFLKLPDHVKNASRWLLNTHLTDNKLLSFIQATIALETLLGDKKESDNVGIQTLLANRAAYLLGKSHKDRNKIIKEVKELYNTRSIIVHKGKETLSLDEKKQLVTLQCYLYRIIITEMQLLSSVNTS